MILIADSGSTKTHWALIDSTRQTRHVYTKGINPFYQTEDEISGELELFLLPQLGDLHIDSIFFYGAGCSFPEKKALVSQALKQHFFNAEIQVESDLLAAARSLFGYRQGIACILGTGSNSCFYDGQEITKNISPLGFILGDEGSGAVLGKTLVADCLKNQLSDELKEKFLAEYNLTPATILDSVYKQPFPNRFLATFAPFLFQNIHYPQIAKIVTDSFNAFFVRNILQYTTSNVEVSFVGSVAFYFRDILKQVANKHGITIGCVLQSPMDGLIDYHKNEL